jgi:hypothetical protein
MSGRVRGGRRAASTPNRAGFEQAIQRIVCISDTHGLHRKVAVPEGDLLIHADDFMRTGAYFEEIADFNDWLGEQPHRHKIVVAGRLYTEEGLIVRTQKRRERAQRQRVP